MAVETITIEGHVGGKPTRPTEKIPHLVSFSVGVTRSFKKKDSTEYTNTTIWYKCNSWLENRSNFLMDAINTGDKVVVIGRPDASAYIAKDGKATASIEINIEQIVLMTKKDKTNQNNDAANSQKYSKQSQHVSDLDDEIPF